MEKDRVSGKYIARLGGRDYFIKVRPCFGPRNLVQEEPIVYTFGPVYEISWTGGLRVTVVDSTTVKKYLSHYNARPMRTPQEAAAAKGA